MRRNNSALRHPTSVGFIGTGGPRKIQFGLKFFFWPRSQPFFGTAVFSAMPSREPARQPVARSFARA